MDLHEALGATLPAGTSQVTLFLPSVDRYGSPIDQDYWQEATLEEFGRLFRGATAFPPGRGVWRDDVRNGVLVFDETIMVTSYIDPSLLDDDSVVDDLRRFLHRLGRDANQGEVAIVIDDEMLSITEFDQNSGERSDNND
jgi:hypothetical protein